MSDCPSSRFCSDCAWPHECAALASCVRREAGEVRSPDDVSKAGSRASRDEPGSGLQIFEEAGRIDPCWYGVDPGHPAGDRTAVLSLDIEFPAGLARDLPSLDFAREWRRQWAAARLAALGRAGVGALAGAAKASEAILASAMLPPLLRWLSLFSEGGRSGLHRGGAVSHHVHLERSRQCGRSADLIMPQRPSYRRRS